MRIDWRLVVAIIALGIAILSFFGGSLWRTSDVVYDQRAVEIPLSDSLRSYIQHALTAAPSDSIKVQNNGKEVSVSPHLLTTLPDKLLYVNIRNVGHVPSATIKVRIVLPGQIADKSISDAGSAFGKVTQLNESDSTGELSFDCQNLSNHPQARIRIALWYQAGRPGTPSVEIQDTTAGMARQVPSIEAARFYWLEVMSSEPVSTIMAILLGLLAFVGTFWLLRATDKRREKRFDLGPGGGAPST